MAGRLATDQLSTLASEQPIGSFSIGSGCVEGQIIKVNGVDRYRVVGSDCSIVADLVTGLEWQRCSVGQTWNVSTQTCDGSVLGFTGDQALTQTAPGGFRLPTITELRSLVYCSNGGFISEKAPGYNGGCSFFEGSFLRPPIVWEAFSNQDISRAFWSASPGEFADYGLVVVFYHGGIAQCYRYDTRTEDFGVRLVRPGQSSAALPNASVSSRDSLSPSKPATPLW